MEQKITEMIKYISESHEALADLLGEGRKITVHLSTLIDEIPIHDASFLGVMEDPTAQRLSDLIGDTAVYLHSLGQLQFAAAQNLRLALQELNGGAEEE